MRNDGSWTAGVGNAKPGVIMLAHPRRGDAYRQEYSLGHAVDQAKVLGAGGRVATPFRVFPHTLLTREYSNLDKQYEKKWYARGIGVMQVDAVTKSREHAELVSVVVVVALAMPARPRAAAPMAPATSAVVTIPVMSPLW